MSLAGSESSQTLRVSKHRAELGAGGAAHAATVAGFSELDVDFLANGALIVVVKDVPVSLPNGVPRWDLCHQEVAWPGWRSSATAERRTSVRARALVLPRFRMSWIRTLASSISG